MLKDGGYLYNWEKNALMEINNDKRALRRTVNEDYAKSAPCLLIFVDRGVINMKDIAALATGRDVAERGARGAGARPRRALHTTSFNRSAIEETLNLGPVMNVMGVLAVGRQ